MEGKGKGGGGEGKERLREVVMGLLREEVVREVSEEKEEKGGKVSKKSGGKKKKIKRGKEGEGAKKGARSGRRVSFGVAQVFFFFFFFFFFFASTSSFGLTFLFFFSFRMSHITATQSRYPPQGSIQRGNSKYHSFLFHSPSLSLIFISPLFLLNL